MPTISWPTPVKSTSKTGTIDYVISNPTTFVTSNNDWLYLDGSEIIRWQSDKTIYDPCPHGYKVPDGGENGVWAKAFASNFHFGGGYDDINKGYNFGASGIGQQKLSSSVSDCWYPTSGKLYNGTLMHTGEEGLYWSCTINSGNALYFYITYGSVSPSMTTSNYASGLSVRCVKE